MSTLNTLQLEINPRDEFNHYDDYYSLPSENAFMDTILTLIDDIPYPVFITKKGKRMIYALNEHAKRGVDNHLIDNVSVDNILNINNTALENNPVVNFNNQWYLVNTGSFQAGNTVYDKIELKPNPEVPNKITLDRCKHMIAVMLHRFRSPLTGIAGYLELLKSETDLENIQNRAKKIDHGIIRLANLMDELEYFYNIPNKFDRKKLEHIELDSILNKVQFDLDKNLRNRIQFLSPLQKKTFFATNEALKMVVKLLVENALEYSPENSPVVISQLSENSIKISNECFNMPEEVKEHIFHPFVTSKANNLGIGLTMALVYANQFGGTIFLTEDGSDGRVSFTICFPYL